MKTLATMIGVLWVGLGMAILPKHGEKPQKPADLAQLAQAEVHLATTQPAPAPQSEATEGIPGIVSLHENEMGEEVVLQFAKSTSYPAPLNSGDILFLKEMGLQDNVIAAAVETAAKQYANLSQGPITPLPEPLPNNIGPSAQTIAEEHQDIANSAQNTQSQPVSADGDIGFFPVAPPEGTPDYNPQSSVTYSQVDNSSTYYFQDNSQSQVTVSSTPEYMSVETTHPVYTETQRVEAWRDELSPHGEWIHTDDYGWCWRPAVVVSDPGWRPYYSSGRWLYTDHGWYWKSGYSWGHVPFHYGRWWRHARFGWMWYPDLVWAPSWVSFRTYDSYCGWAPLPPRAYFWPGAGFYYSGQRVSAGFGFGLGSSDFIFLSYGNFCDPLFYRHVLTGPRNYHVYHNSTVINNYNVDVDNVTIINNGVPVADVENIGNTKIERIAVRKTETTLDVAKRDSIDRNGKVPTIYREDISPKLAKSSSNRSPSSNFAASNSGPSPINQVGRRPSGSGNTSNTVLGTSSTTTRSDAGRPGQTPSSARLSTSSPTNPKQKSEYSSKPSVASRGNEVSNPQRSSVQMSRPSPQSPVLGTSGITIRGEDSKPDLTTRPNPSTSRSQPSLPSNVWASPSNNASNFSNSRSQWDNNQAVPAQTPKPGQAARSSAPQPIMVPEVRSSPSRIQSVPRPAPSIQAPSVRSIPSPSRPSIQAPSAPRVSPPEPIRPSVRSTPSPSRPAPSSGPIMVPNSNVRSSPSPGRPSNNE